MHLRSATMLDGFGTICFVSVDLKDKHKTAIEVCILTIMAFEITNMIN